MASLEISREVAEDRERWDRFCSEDATGWFWHTTAWREYTLAYGSSLASRSLAFGVMDGEQLVAATPLMLERHQGAAGPRHELSFGGAACWAPALARGLSAEARQAALGHALEEIDGIAGTEGAARASLQLSPLVPDLGAATVSLLGAATEAGWVDASVTTQVVDLSLSEDQLHRRMHTGHRRNVKKAQRSLTVDAHHAETASDGPFDAYRRIHEKAAGRVTRPDSTFEQMREWISEGNGLLLCAQRDGEIVGCVYVLLSGDAAYYASGANDPAAAGEPVGHILHWEAIRWLKAKGLRRYELGPEKRGMLPHDPATSKDLGIARFKRGFGGVTAPLVVREKYYSADFQRAVGAERGERTGPPDG